MTDLEGAGSASSLPTELAASPRRLAARGLLIDSALLGAVVALVLGLFLLDGRVDLTSLQDALGTSAEIMAGVLAVAVTVVAIVVELAATRFSHRITYLFVTERINIAVLSMFVVTTIACLAYGFLPPDRLGAPALWLTLVLLLASLVVLLPYLVFVFTFISPLSVIERLVDKAARAFERAAMGHADDATKRQLLSAIDEVQEIARSAVDSGDRSIAIACVRQFTWLAERHRATRQRVDASWFELTEPVRRDADFIGFDASVLDLYAGRRTWVEIKLMRQFVALMQRCVPEARGEANVLAIAARELGTFWRDEPELLSLSLRTFNTYLNIAVQAGDRRTAYYVMNQYRLLAEELLDEQPSSAREVAERLGFYGQLAHSNGHSFLLEASAFDLASLCRKAVDVGQRELAERIVSVLLEMDQEIRSERQESSLLGVRFAQMRLGAWLLSRDERALARRVAADVAAEPKERRDRIASLLRASDSAEFWELTDRQDTFRYLEPDLHAPLDELLAMIEGSS